MTRCLNKWIPPNRIASVYRIDPLNVGDLVSSPIHYFPYLSQATQLDVNTEARRPRRRRFRGMVLGGGGCIGYPSWLPLLDHYASSAIPVKIIWGAGQNVHDSTAVQFPAALDKFHLVGLRDSPNPWQWVPCPSCLHPAFDRTYEVKHRFVFFEQSLFSPIDSGEHPKMSNTMNDLDRIIEFLGSGETVFSSSYHGVYWATLLGRKAVAVNPFSSKFHRLRFPVPIVSTNDWEAAARDATAYPTALKVCRDANVAFSKQAWTLLAEKAGMKSPHDHTPSFSLQKPVLPKPRSKAAMLPMRAFRKVGRIVKSL